MIVIGHRGASGYAPEHTFASWDLALELGADYLEQDLQMTRDGVLVVMHDDTLDRTVRGRTGRVIDHDWQDLRDCDAGSWFNVRNPARARDAFANERIATLDDVFARYSDRACFYVETKNPEEAPGMEEALLALIDRHGLRKAAAREWRVLIQSFSTPSLERLHALDPSLPLIQLLPIGWRLRRNKADALRRIARICVGIGPSWRDINEKTVKLARGLCLEVHPWTVNEPALMERMTGIGVTGMFTDVPDVLLGLRPDTESRGSALIRAVAEDNASCRQQGH